MPVQKVGTREQWLEARRELLEAEKELTRKSDELAQRRQTMPWVPIDKDYRFSTEEGEASFEDLFRGKSQLLIYHFMFGPDFTAGCPSCSAIADGFDGIIVHLANHDVTLWALSRAPLERLVAYKRRMGWGFPWASTIGSEFNADFGVLFTEEQRNTGAIEYNYRLEPPDDGQGLVDSDGDDRTPVDALAATCGTDAATYVHERPGMSSFTIENGIVYHTYSTYSRGLDALWGMYQWLDRAPKGRNETDIWYRRHDEYERG